MVGFERFLGKRAKGETSDYMEKRTVLGTIEGFYFWEGAPVAVIQEDMGNLAVTQIGKIQIVDNVDNKECPL